MKMFRMGWLAGLALMIGLTAGQANAGSIVIDGTDSNEHGGTSGGLNTGGWLYMQKVLENLASTTTSTAKIVYNIGGAGPVSSSAIASAFNLSSLPGAGWTMVNVNTAAGITALLSTSWNASNIGILAISTSGNSTGDLATIAGGLAAVNAGAANIAASVAAGGGLHAMGETGAGAFGWLSTLLPGIVVTDQTAGGVNSAISLTLDGAGAFPGLTSADLSTGPWHANFANFNPLLSLGTAPDGNNITRNVIIGGSALTGGGNFTPVPGGVVLVGTALPFLAGFLRRRKNVVELVG